MVNRAANTLSVYFVQAGERGPIKIGKTTWKPNKRMINLSSGSHEKLKVLGVIENAPDTLEKELHRRFAGSRIRREWFRPDDELIRFIADHAVAMEPVAKPTRPENESNLTRRLRRMLDDRGCTITEAAKLAGMESQQAWRIVTGKTTNPGILTVQRLVEAVGGTMAELFSDED